MIKITKEDRRLQHAAGEPGATSRYSLEGVHFNKEFAVATDGRGIVVKKKTSDISNATIRFASADSKKDNVFYPFEKCAGETMEAQHKCDAAHVLEGRFPPWEDCFKPALEQKSKLQITLDAAVLLKLAKALSNGEKTWIQLDISAPDKPIVVKGYENDDATGILMPVSGDGGTSPREILTTLMKKKESP